MIHRDNANNSGGDDEGIGKQVEVVPAIKEVPGDLGAPSRDQHRIDNLLKKHLENDLHQRIVVFDHDEGGPSANELAELAIKLVECKKNHDELEGCSDVVLRIRVLI